MSSVAALAATAVRMQGAAFAQQVGTAVARQQIDAQKAVLELLAPAASASPAPAGQGKLVDLRA